MSDTPTPGQTAWRMLPPSPALCQQCAGAHTETEPHNRDSLYYQLTFHQREGRWPTWEDAMAHCPPEVQQCVRLFLKEHPHA